jgi:hypothetical protein
MAKKRVLPVVVADRRKGKQRQADWSKVAFGAGQIGARPTLEGIQAYIEDYLADKARLKELQVRVGAAEDVLKALVEAFGPIDTPRFHVFVERQSVAEYVVPAHVRQILRVSEKKGGVARSS